MKEIAGVCSNTFKILIVDDIPLNLLLLDKMLKPFEFQLVKASNGREALHAIQERLGTPEEIDLAIVDLMMPDIDGYKVIEVLRNGSNDGEFNIPAHSKEKLPIVILSGMNFSEDIKRWLGAWCQPVRYKACCHGATLQHYHRRINKENTGR